MRSVSRKPAVALPAMLVALVLSLSLLAGGTVATDRSEPGPVEVARAYRLPDGAVVLLSALQVPGDEGEDNLDDLVPDGEPLDPEVTAQFMIYRKWPSDLMPVVVQHNPAGAPDGIDAGPIVQWAGQTWAAVPGQTWQFIYGGTSSTVADAECGGESTRDGENLVAWADLPNDRRTLAFTCSLFVYNPDVPNCSSGDYDCLDGHPMVVESDIVINSVPPRSSGEDRFWSVADVTPGDAYDLYSNILHEMGHVVGLQHSYIKNPVMHPVLNAEIQKRELKEDDINGVLDLYAGEPPPPLQQRAFLMMSVRE